jgi:hypothetical protein
MTPTPRIWDRVGDQVLGEVLAKVTDPAWFIVSNHVENKVEDGICVPIMEQLEGQLLRWLKKRKRYDAT